MIISYRYPRQFQKVSHNALGIPLENTIRCIHKNILSYLKIKLLSRNVLTKLVNTIKVSVITAGILVHSKF